MKDHHVSISPKRPELLQRFAHSLLLLLGWRSIAVWPPVSKGVVIVYPHTSNWDFVIGILFKLGAGLPIRWIGKDSLFRWPFRALLVRLGGIPINRRAPMGLVREIQAEFARHDWMWLALAPEGTRARTDHWKSGFYRIAVAARLPVALGYIDYATRTVGIDTYLELTGERDQDLKRIREFYADKHGRRPGLASDIRLQG